MENIELIIFVAFQVLFLIFMSRYFPVVYWLQAQFSGVRVGLMELIFMAIRRLPMKTIVTALITLTKAGLRIDINDLQTHAMAGGNLDNLVKGLVYAKNASIELSMEEAQKLDHQQINLVEFLQKHQEKKALD